MSNRSKIAFVLSFDMSGGLALNIEEHHDDGPGMSYRIFGPRSSGTASVVHTHEITAHDAKLIRTMIDYVDGGGDSQTARQETAPMLDMQSWQR